ncbi:MAG: hypothetical protein AAF843_10005 [Bacteroidota bacterium]
MKFLLLISAFLFSFPSLSQSIYPMEHGNEWRMKYANEFDQTGETYMISKILENKKEIGGKNYYQIKTTVYSTKEAKEGISNTSFIRTDADGNLMGITNQTSTEEEIMLPEELSIGKTWIGDQGVNKVIDLNATIETPEKSYTGCVAISTGENAMISYWKKGIGPVAIIINGKLMAYLYEYELN